MIFAGGFSRCRFWSPGSVAEKIRNKISQADLEMILKRSLAGILKMRRAEEVQNFIARSSDIDHDLSPKNLSQAAPLR